MRAQKFPSDSRNTDGAQFAREISAIPRPYAICAPAICAKFERFYLFIDKTSKRETLKFGMFVIGNFRFLKTCAIAFAAQAAFATEGFCAEVKGEHLFDVLGFPVTNSMFTTWVFAAAIILGFRLMIGREAKLVPGRGQMAVEAVISSLSGIFEPLMGKKAFRAAFPLLLGFFFFILIMNWSGLLPGVGSIGEEIVYTGQGTPPEGFFLRESSGSAAAEFVKFVPFLRAANSDLNTTLALAMISFGAWIYFVLKYAGLKVFLHDTFGNKADPKEVALPIYLSLFAVFFAVGCIDIISIIMRLLSLSFRLFGNVFGGEVLLENMHSLAAKLPSWISWVIPLPFYLLEILIGLIQAFLFTLLTAVYIGLLTNHEEE